MFTDAELSRRKVDNLLELWAATLVPHGDLPPITNHRDLCQEHGIFRTFSLLFFTTFYAVLSLSTLFFLSFTPQEKTIRVLLIP